jgi:hypothetical protein
MVLGNVLCALNLASSVAMNGVCCYYQKQEEEEKRREHHEAVRRAIRSEWDRHRLMEMEWKLRENEMGLQAATLTEQRRQQLMKNKNILIARKAKPSPVIRNMKRSEDLRDQSPSTTIDLPTATPSNIQGEQTLEASCYSSPLPEFKNMVETQPLLRVSSFAEIEISRNGMYLEGRFTSLLDDSDDDELEDVDFE